MGSRLTNELRGLAFLGAEWDGAAINADDSSYTEADPRPGSSSTSDTLARSKPSVIGAQSVPVNIIGTRVGGMPGIGPEGAGVSYYLDGEAEADARHHRPAHSIMDARNFGTSPTGSVSITSCVAYGLTGHVLAAVSVGQAGANSPLWLWTPSTGLWTNPTTAPTEQGALVQIPDSTRVLWVDEEDGAVYFSDDFGTTWTLYANTIPFRDIGGSSGGTYEYINSVRTMTVDQQGQISWCGRRNDASGNIDFFVSADFGHRWQRTATLTSTSRASTSFHPSGSIALATITSAGDVEFRMLPTTGADPNAIVPVTVYQPGRTIDEVVVVCDEEGAIWLYMLARTGATYLYVEFRVSWDNGETWEGSEAGYVGPSGDDAAVITGEGRDDSSTQYTQGMTACASMGSVWLFCGAQATDAGTMVLRLGGWQGPYFDLIPTDGNPQPVRDPRYRLRMGEGLTGQTSQAHMQLLPAAPKDGLSGSGATFAGTSGTESLANGAVRMAPGSGSVWSYTRTFNPTTHDHDAWMRLRLASDVPASLDIMGVRLDGNLHSWAIWYSDESFKVVDLDSSATLATVSYDSNDVIEMEVLYDDSDGELTVLYINRTEDPTGTKWTTLNLTLSGSHAATGNAILAFGFVGTATSGGLTADWYYFCARVTPAVDGALPQSRLSARNGWGKAIDGAYGYPVPDAYDAATQRVSRLIMRGGPLVRTETYNHDVAPDRPIENLFPTVDSSPDARWRSVAKTDQVLAADLGDAENLVAGSYSWLVLVQKANVRRITVAGRVTAGSYADLGTIDLATGFDACSFVRSGAVLRPDSPYTGTAGARYIAPGELRGGHVILDPSGSPVYRRIRTNTGGLWSGDTAAATIILEGVESADPTSGTVVIVWPSGVMAIHRTVAQGPLRRLRFTIDSTADGSPDDYYEIGTLAPFGLRPTGKQWANGWEWDRSPNVQIDSGTQRSERRRRLGPSQRSLTLSWDDGFQMVRLRASTSPDYVGDASGAFLTARDEVWGQLWEWLELSVGASRTVLWCGKVPGNGVTITDPTLFLHGYFVPQGVRVGQSTGDEGVDEYYRASGIQIREAV